MTDMLELPELPFPTTPSQAGAWRRGEDGDALVATAPAHTDFSLNPGGDDSADAESILNAATLLGTPSAGAFQLSARVSADFRAQYDGGVLMVWMTFNHIRFTRQRLRGQASATAHKPSG